MSSIKIFVVLVTYNRIDKLRRALDSYAIQEYRPSDIVVVDNCSTDGTKEFLDLWKEVNIKGITKHVFHMDRNLGGSGGFKIGIEKAMELEPDWVWISDDDAYPQPDALRRLKEAITDERFKDVACFCGTVCDKKLDIIDTAHRRYNKKRVIIFPNHVPEEDYKCEYRSIDETSFVGSCYKADVLRKVGGPNDELFIYFDDTDHSHRVRRYGKIMLLPKIKILHDTGAYSVTDPDVVSTWREYYLVRNHVYALKKYHWLTYIAYVLMKICKIWKEYMMHRSKPTRKMLLDGIRDGMKEKLGIHPIYKPGFEIKK